MSTTTVLPLKLRDALRHIDDQKVNTLRGWLLSTDIPLEDFPYLQLKDDCSEIVNNAEEAPIQQKLMQQMKETNNNVATATE